jgi:phosphoglycolate phosphatase-like HAD superfamily hydrolase
MLPWRRSALRRRRDHVALAARPRCAGERGQVALAVRLGALEAGMARASDDEMRRYAAVLLDVDGTLVDSNDAHAHAWVEALGRRGIEVSFARVRRMIGMGGDRLIAEATGLPADGEKTRKLQDEHAAVFAERWLRHVKAIDGARELVLQLRRDNYEVALATAAHEDVLRPLLEIAGIADLLDGKAQPPKPPKSKPHPAAIEVALGQLDADRSRVVLIGDTPYDVEAGRAASVDVLGVTTGGYSAEALAGAVAVYRGPSDLLAQWQRTPLGS